MSHCWEKDPLWNKDACIDTQEQLKSFSLVSNLVNNTSDCDVDTAASFPLFIFTPVLSTLWCRVRFNSNGYCWCFPQLSCICWILLQPLHHSTFRWAVQMFTLHRDCTICKELQSVWFSTRKSCICNRDS